jgi:type II secretory pathway pseudopilin PulG
MVRNQQGATILEAIIAMIILALVIIGLNTGVVSIIRSNLHSKDLSSATAAGYRRFEMFRRMEYAEMTMVGTSIDIGEQYVCDWQMDVLTGQTKIDLEVRWPASSQVHAIQLSTIIAEP